MMRGLSVAATVAAFCFWSSGTFAQTGAINKAVGGYTRRLADVRPGTRVVAEGPFGTFTAQRRRRERVLLIAGGIGITPLRGLFEDMPGDLRVVETLTPAAANGWLSRIAAAPRTSKS